MNFKRARKRKFLIQIWEKYFQNPSQSQQTQASMYKKIHCITLRNMRVCKYDGNTSFYHFWAIDYKFKKSPLIFVIFVK
jgi:hypothetical protein